MKSEYWLAYVAPLVAAAMAYWFGRKMKNAEAAKVEGDVIRQLQDDIAKWSDAVQAMSLRFSESELKSAAEIASLRIENASLKADVQILRHENEQLKSEVARLTTQMSG